MIDVPAGSIMRNWTGWIKPESRAAYSEYLERTGLREYRSTEGNLGAFAAFRDLPDGRCEVRTISFWTSREAVANFAGEEIDAAVFYPEDDAFLIDRDLRVTHFDVG